jgi:RIO-like serine/threonine protein kinase
MTKVWDFLMSKKVIKGGGSGSRLVIDKQNKVVEKYFSNSKKGKRLLKQYPNLINREVFWLEKLESFDRTPKLISHDMERHLVVMEYMGERLTKQNIPTDYETQVTYILDGLKQFECSHNDIKPTELLVLDGKINIIDFGWSTKIGEPIPKNWPWTVGGRNFQFKPYELDDEYSFRKSIEWILTK